MAARSRGSKRNNRRPARKQARAKARPKARKLAKARTGKARRTAKPQAVRRRAAAKRPMKSRKAAVPRQMKRAKPARKAKRKVAPKPARLQAARPARKPPARPPQPQRPVAAAPARKAPARERLPLPPGSHGRPGQRPALDRNRRVLPPDERFDDGSEASAASEETARMLSAVRTGRDEIRQQLEQHNETSPRMTAGDVDAKWQDAYAVGDEAPGGDNMTPDQDIVDDIGRALGVEYADDEELKGADKLEERDRHRWELDPASSEDWPHGDKDSD